MSSTPIATERTTGPSSEGVIWQVVHRVNYSEVDQMGVVYHARYLVWLDMARTEYLRRQGMSYRELEERGYRLAVGDVWIRYRQPARYDDQIRVRCWVEDAGSRRVTFGYAVELEPTGAGPASLAASGWTDAARGQRPTSSRSPPIAAGT